MSVRISCKTRNPDFFEEIEKLSGQDIFQCFQCGICSGTCPMSDAMDVLPRKIIHLAHIGQEEKLKSLKTYWVCSSCQSCGVRCPRGIDLPKVMEALRLMTLRKNLNYIEPSQLSADTLRECPPIVLVAAFRKMTS